MDDKSLIQVKNCLEFSYHKNIDDIKKILKLINISYFHFNKIWFNGDRISITTNPEFIEHFYTFDIHKEGKFHQHHNIKNWRKVIWSEMVESERLIESRSNFDVGNIGFTLIRTGDFSSNIYHFASEDYLTTMNLTTTGSELINKFINYFHCKYQKFISNIIHQKFHIPFTANTHLLNHNHIQSEAFIKEVNINKHYLANPDCYLTNKEILVIENLVKGKSLKEISKSLFVSERTIETHVENVKNKLECKKISELIYLLSKELNY